MFHSLFFPMASRLFRRRGFTLIELLLVIGIIAILASIVIVAINPTKQLGDARNAQRRSDVNTILNAVYQYAIDNNGNLPTGIPTGSASAKIICQSTADPATCIGATVGGINLRMLTGSYVVSIPRDPQFTTTGTGSRYFMYQDTSGRITVTAPFAERGASISVTR
jgi:type IV pilus assembly protein PilA